MPASPATSPARNRVTETRAIIHATQVDVMFSGDACRLNLYTLDGIYRVALPLKAFIAKCRAPHDANGHPFPASMRSNADVERELAADAAVVAVPFVQTAAASADVQTYQIFRADVAQPAAGVTPAAARGAAAIHAASEAGVEDEPTPQKRAGNYRGRVLAPGQAQKYLAAYIDRRRSGDSWRVVALRHGLSDVRAYRWCCRHPAQCEAAWTASRPPVTKPSGRIL